MAKWPLYLTASCAHNVAKNFGLPEILTWLSLRCCHYQELDALKGFNFHVSVIHTWILSCPELDLERTTSQRTRKCFPTTYLHIFHVDKHFNVLFNIQQKYFKELVPGEKTAKYTYLFSGVNTKTWIQLLDGYVYSCSFGVPITETEFRIDYDFISLSQRHSCSILEVLSKKLNQNGNFRAQMKYLRAECSVFMSNWILESVRE